LSANERPSEALPRRPGRPKGLPRPPGAGRKPGTPNKVTRDIREAASKHGAKALSAIVKLLKSPDEKVVAVAAREILDRAYGKSIQPSELTGKDGDPLIPARELSDHTLAKLIAYQLDIGTAVTPETKPLAPRLEEPETIAAPPDPAAILAASVDAVMANADTENVIPLDPSSERWQRHTELAESRPDQRVDTYRNRPTVIRRNPNR
jgi:hypothetical protein